MTDRTTYIEPEQIKTVTAHISTIRYCQQCMLCENSRTLPEGMHYCNTPWVCDECKEAIDYLKQLKAKSEMDPLQPILD